MPKKHRLFEHSGEYGVKFSGKWGKLSTAERVHRDIVRGIFNADPRKISKKSKEDLKKVVKEMAKEVNKRAKQLRDLWDDERIGSPALIDLDETGGNIDPNQNDISDLLGEYIRARSFLSDESSTVDGARQFQKEVAVDADKWTIIHRLEKVDPRLLVNRAYWSETLHTIESYIAEEKYNKDEITDMMIERLTDIYEYCKEKEKHMKHFH